MAALGYQPHTLEEFRAHGFDAKREPYWMLGTLGADAETEELQVQQLSSSIMSYKQLPLKSVGDHSESSISLLQHMCAVSTASVASLQQGCSIAVKKPIDN